jgi:ankyrin repeat protein
MADPVPEYLHLNNQIPTKENIALFEAAVAGDFNRVKTLLKQGAKPNFFHRPEDQKNALHVAAEHAYDDIVDLLLQNGAAVNAIAATDQSTALILASHHGNPKILNLLINAGADIQAGI